jgi:spore maturation protein CgeB
MVILGLSITSSWGNGHASTYRGLVRELTARGHRVLFLERDQPCHAGNRDLPVPPFGRTEIYASLEELADRFAPAVRHADFVIVGSGVPQGVQVGRWVTETAAGATAFYDIDTPVTLARLARGDHEYLAPELIPRFRAYLSFAGGPVLRLLERRYGSPMARALYGSFDPQLFRPEEMEPRWDLGYLGAGGDDRQPALERLLAEPARRWPQGRFAVAGPQDPREMRWPRNVERCGHLEPGKISRFYNRQRFTLNVTRAGLLAAGFSPGVRLFEAAACATPIISDNWPGLGTFFRIGEEILTAKTPGEVLQYLREIPEHERRALGERARARVLSEHTATRRAEELEGYALQLHSRQAA